MKKRFVVLLLAVLPALCLCSCFLFQNPFLLTVEVEPPEGGTATVTPASDTSLYYMGTPLSINAVPAAGYKFVSYKIEQSFSNKDTGSTTDTDNPLSLKMYCDTKVIVYFAPMTDAELMDEIQSFFDKHRDEVKAENTEEVVKLYKDPYVAWDSFSGENTIDRDTARTNWDNLFLTYDYRKYDFSSFVWESLESNRVQLNCRLDTESTEDLRNYDAFTSYLRFVLEKSGESWEITKKETHFAPIEEN